MDNVCHTLVGAAMAGAGLHRRTRFAGSALMISANLPDIDVLVFATSIPAVAFRRGWTHGALAQLLLPLALTALIVMAARVRGRPPRSASGDGPPLRIAWLLALSYAGVLSHVGLDYLNNYGVRLLAPLNWRWFYGDAVFIIDLWLWGALGAGIWLTRRIGRPAPARGALIFAVLYITMMVASARAAGDIVRDTWRRTWGESPRAVMVGPLPVTPLQREIIVDRGDRYESGTFSWPTLTVTVSPHGVPKNDHGPEVALARESPAISGFLAWSRFPYWEVEALGSGTRVTVRDMRFGGRFSASTVLRSEP